MVRNKYDVFISYRRVGGKEKARPLKSELEKRGYKVFLDFDDLKDSVFDKRIMDAIDEAPIFLIILSEHSLDRCKNEDDWVRKEIEYANKKNKHFVPVNPDKEFKDFPEDIPNSVKECIGQHQFSSIDFEQLFQLSIDKMVEDRIQPIIARLRETSKKQTGALIRIETDLDCRVLRFKEELAIAKADDITEIRLPKGKHKLTFEGLECKDDSYSTIYEVKDLDYEDYIEVNLLEKYNVRKAEESKQKAEQERIEKERRLEKERQEREAKAKADQEKNKQSSGTINGHEYVDLGLPSGLKWATCNVGANKPEDYGDYFAWGETEMKTEYSKENSLPRGSRSKLRRRGLIDGNNRLTSSYDAARANWGGSWRMPTKDEMQELVDYCEWEWTEVNGVKGSNVTGPNGNSIFLPAAGYRLGSSLGHEGSHGYYWSSTPYDYYDDNAYNLYFYYGYEGVDCGNRSCGQTVRPISE